MYLTREVMHCKPGKVGQMVAKFKELATIMKELGYKHPMQIMTDVSGDRYWTVVVEQVVDSLDGHAELARQTMSDPRIQKAMAGYHELVESGRREFFKIES